MKRKTIILVVCSALLMLGTAYLPSWSLQVNAQDIEHIKPTSHIDRDDTWITEAQAYDNNMGGGADANSIPPNGWSGFLEFYHTGVMCDAVEFYALSILGRVDKVDVDIKYEDAWHDVYQGSYGNYAWVVKYIPAGKKLVEAMRYRFYNSDPTRTRMTGIVEVAFLDTGADFVPPPPEPIPPPPTAPSLPPDNVSHSANISSNYTGVNSVVLWYCETLAPSTAEKIDIQVWYAPSDVAIIGFELESHIMIVRSAVTSSEGTKNIVMSNAYLSFDKGAPVHSWYARTVCFLIYRNGQWIGNDNNTQIVMFPEGHGILMAKGDAIYLNTFAKNAIDGEGNRNAGCGSQVCLYYVELEN